MVAAHHKLKVLLVQGPAVEALPEFAKRPGNGKFGVPRLEGTDDLGGIAAQELQLEPRKGPDEFGKRRKEQFEADGVRQGQPKRGMNAFLDGAGEFGVRRRSSEGG